MLIVSGKSTFIYEQVPTELKLKAEYGVIYKKRKCEIHVYFQLKNWILLVWNNSRNDLISLVQV